MTNKCFTCGREFESQYPNGYCSPECSKLPTEEELSNKIKHDYELTEIEVQKINLQPGDSLLVTVKNNYIEPEAARSISDGFKKAFPNNQVLVMAMDSEGDVKLAVVSQPIVANSAPLGYCTNCDCGKKEAIEGKK